MEELERPARGRVNIQLISIAAPPSQELNFIIIVSHSSRPAVDAVARI